MIALRAGAEFRHPSRVSSVEMQLAYAGVDIRSISPSSADGEPMTEVFVLAFVRVAGEFLMAECAVETGVVEAIEATHIREGAIVV